MIFTPKINCSPVDETDASESRFDYFRIDFIENRSPKVSAPTAAGLFYANDFLDSLNQEELRSFKGKTVEDWADLKCRGFMLDISRNRVPTMEWLKTLVKKLALLRYNELQLYTEHVFAYSGHEAVWKDASPLTAQEIQELDQFCAARHIELVPNQNSFGHMERWLRNAAYRHLAESPDGFEHPIAGWRAFGSTLYPSEDSRRFVDQLYSELLPNFRSVQLHIGGDEPWELGKGRSKQAVTQYGKHAVYLNFMKQLIETAQRHGKIPHIWADIILERPDTVCELPKGVRPVIWGYEADSPFENNCRILSDAGFQDEFYVAPGAGNWNSFGGRLDVARANIQLAARCGKQFDARGMLLTAWGDNGHHQPWPTLFGPLILGGHHSWNVDAQVSDTQLATHIDYLFYPSSPNGNGERLCQLGYIDRLLPQPLPPMSFLHAAFFNERQAFEALLRTTSEDELLSVKEALSNIQMAALDPEIALGIRFNTLAIERCLAMLNGRPVAYEKDATLEALKLEFAKIWLLRSRPGGLQESLEKIDAALSV